MKLSLPPPVVVFVRPQNSGNVGAIARVMSNFGIKELRLVNEPVGDNEAFNCSGIKQEKSVDWILAVKGRKLLEEAPVLDSLQEALADTHVAIGSTGRPRDFDTGYSRPCILMDEALDETRHYLGQMDNAPEFKWALVIGSEVDGLTEIEASLCRQLVQIPTHPENPSMNAAMASGCLLYHWFSQEQSASKEIRGPYPKRKDRCEPGRKDWATAWQWERFCQYLMSSLEMTDFMKYPDQDAVEARIRRLALSGPIPTGELLFAFELLYHLRAKITGEFTPRDFLSGSADKLPRHLDLDNPGQ